MREKPTADQYNYELMYNELKRESCKRNVEHTATEAKLISEIEVLKSGYDSVLRECQIQKAKAEVYEFCIKTLAQAGSHND